MGQKRSTKVHQGPHILELLEGLRNMGCLWASWINSPWMDPTNGWNPWPAIQPWQVRCFAASPFTSKVGTGCGRALPSSMGYLGFRGLTPQATQLSWPSWPRAPGMGSSFTEGMAQTCWKWAALQEYEWDEHPFWRMTIWPFKTHSSLRAVPKKGRFSWRRVDFYIIDTEESTRNGTVFLAVQKQLDMFVFLILGMFPTFLIW